MAKKTTTIAGTAIALNYSLLAAIVSATQAGGFLYVSEADASPLVTAGFVETNAQLKNEAGDIAARSTEAGAAASAAAAQPVANTNPTQLTDSNTNDDDGNGDDDDDGFEIEDNIPISSVKRGGNSGTTYPFDKLQVGQSFHVKATTDRPNPAKSLASTVSSATARYAVEVKDDNGNVVTEVIKVKEPVKDAAGNEIKGEDGKTIMHEVSRTVAKMLNTRVFSVRTVGDSDPKGAGARIWRTA